MSDFLGRWNRRQLLTLKITALALGLIDEKCAAETLLDRAVAVANQLATIPAGAFALTKEAFSTLILDRTACLSDLNARVVHAWMQPHTYDTIRAYLERTVRKSRALLLPDPIADREPQLTRVAFTVGSWRPGAADLGFQQDMRLAGRGRDVECDQGGRPLQATLVDQS